MATAGDGERIWSRRCGGGALLLLALAVGPVIYCMGWAEMAADASMSTCMATHPLQFPVLLVVSGFGLAIAAVGLHIRAGQAEAEQRRRRRKMDRSAQRLADRQKILTPRQGGQRGGDSDALPDEIELDQELDLGLDGESEARESFGDEESDSIMVFLEREQRARKSDDDGQHGASQATVEQGKYYIPPGLGDAPVLYVEADGEPQAVVDGEKRIGNPNLAHQSLNDALRQAQRLVMDRHTAVLVRVKPGVYQEAVEIPDRVTVINHRMPASTTIDQRIDWLRDQVEVDHPDRVTLLAPSDAEVGVTMTSGQKQGLFGCYLVGRQGVSQSGLKCRKNAALAVVHCAFESFSSGAVVVEHGGEDSKGRKVQFVGCLWRGNTASTHGGALRVTDSVVRIESSVFDSNRAPSGGAISIVDSETPLRLERCMLHRNRALTDEISTAVDKMPLKQWQKTKGVGGAICVRQGLLKVVDTVFEGNDARVGGGGIAALGARVVITSTGDSRGVCRGNRADAGGGVLAVGWVDSPAMIRGKSAEWRQNLGSSTGGAAAAVGNAVLHLEEVVMEVNRAAGGERGIGGAIAAWRGAGVQIKAGEYSANKATGGGGAIAVINGSLKIIELCVIRNNHAQGKAGGGGLLVISGPDRDLETVIGQDGFDLPFKLKLGDVRIRANQTPGCGGGLRAGNLVDSTTFPLAIQIRRPQWINLNEGNPEVRLNDNVWIEWAGKLAINDDTRDEIKRVLS